MIGLDTNGLVRLAERDDPEMTAAAEGFLTAARDRGESLFVADLVLAELVWVLSRGRYRRPKAHVVRVLRAIVDGYEFRFERRDRVAAALDAWEAGPGDFAYYLVREQAKGAGCSDIVKFDVLQKLTANG